LTRFFPTLQDRSPFALSLYCRRNAGILLFHYTSMRIISAGIYSGNIQILTL
jgi:hypothetical protein